MKLNAVFLALLSYAVVVTQVYAQPPPVAPSNPVLEPCLIEEGEQYFDNLFWFASDGNFTDGCYSTIDDGPFLEIECDWTDALRGKGRAYEYVEKACNEKGGLMFVAHYLRTENKYSVRDVNETINVTEIGNHYNVPVCLSPSQCDPKEVLHQVTPCSQFDNWYPFDEDSQSWNYTDDIGSKCFKQSILAATYMDEECENKLTYILYDENENTCSDKSDDNLYICDFSDFTEVGGIGYNSDLCDDANQYKYSYRLDRVIEENSASHYFLNNPTCLKEGCDVESYFYKNLIPYHSFESIHEYGYGKRDFNDNESNRILQGGADKEDAVPTTIGMGILLAAEKEMKAKSAKSTKSSKSSKDSKAPKDKKSPILPAAEKEMKAKSAKSTKSSKNSKRTRRLQRA